MNEAEEIKSRTDIVELVNSYLPLKKTGANYKGLCPFHQEKTPSFMVNPERQIYKCFGCGEGGDVFEFAMKMENLSFPEALKMLASRAGVELKSGALSSKKYRSQTDVKSKIFKINALAAQVYHKILLEHRSGEKALNYLSKRKIKRETIKKFRLGCAPDKQVLKPFLLQKGFSEDDLRQAGSPHLFGGRLIFPLTDVLGNVLGFTGRSLDPEKMPKYFNTPETKVFTKGKVLYGLEQAKNAVKKLNYIVLAEGQMDVISASQNGIENVVASSGTALTSDHLRIIGRYTDNLIASLDMDDAGQKATLTLMELALKADFNLKIAVLPPPLKDAGEALEKDPSIFKKALRQAAPAFSWLIDRTLSSSAKKGELSPAAKKKAVREIAPFILLVRDSVERAEWENKLAFKLNVPLKNVAASIAAQEQRIKSRSGERQNGSKNPASDSSQPPLTTDELLYGLLVAFPESRRRNGKLYSELNSSYNSKRETLKSRAQQYLASFSGAEIKKEIERLAEKRKKLKAESIKQKFALKIAQAEKAGDRKELKKLLKQLQDKIKDNRQAKD